MSRTVFLTGTSSGFGRRSVTAFLEAGWNVAATLRNPVRFDGEQSERLFVHELDVRDENSVLAGVEAASERFGGIDVVVNNAGAGLFSVFESTPMSMVDEVFDTNVFGPMRVIRAALPVFAARGRGRIVNVTSNSAVLPTPLQAVYGASKAALHTFSEGLEYELASIGVDIKVVEPGFVAATGLVAQTGGRFAGTPVPDAYRTIVEQQLSVFSAPPSQTALTTEDEVARTIVDAATDESGTFRFRVGQDAIDSYEAARQSDADYTRWRREKFAPAS